MWSILKIPYNMYEHHLPFVRFSFCFLEGQSLWYFKIGDEISNLPTVKQFLCVWLFMAGKRVFRAVADNYVIKASREENKLRNSSCMICILNKNSSSNILFAYSRKKPLSESLSIYCMGCGACINLKSFRWHFPALCILYFSAGQDRWSNYSFPSGFVVFACLRVLVMGICLLFFLLV